RLDHGLVGRNGNELAGLLDLDQEFARIAWLGLDAAEALEMDLGVGPTLLLGQVDHDVHHHGRAADIEMLAWSRLADKGGEVGLLLVRPVVEMEFDLVVELGAGDPVVKRGAGAAARAIVENEISADGMEPLRHRQDRRHADAARDENAFLRVRRQRKEIVRAPDQNSVALLDVIGESGRATAALQLTLHAEHMARRFRRSVAQRELTNLIADLDVEMGARLE